MLVVVSHLCVVYIGWELFDNFVEQVFDTFRPVKPIWHLCVDHMGRKGHQLNILAPEFKFFTFQIDCWPGKDAEQRDKLGQCVNLRIWERLRRIEKRNRASRHLNNVNYHQKNQLEIFVAVQCALQWWWYEDGDDGGWTKLWWRQLCDDDAQKIVAH